MRKLLLIVGASALAASMPTLAEKGGKGGGKGGAEHGQHGGGGKPGKGNGGGGGNAKPAKHERQAFQASSRPAKQERQASRGGAKPAKQERHAQRGNAKPPKHERQAARGDWQREERKLVAKQAKQQERSVRDSIQDRRGDGFRSPDLRDGRDFRDGDRRYAAAVGQNCPPGLAKKGNGCMPPGQANKAFAVGDRVQQTWFGGYNVPSRYSAFYHDTAEQYYRYGDNGYIYRVDSRSNLISGLVPLLGGGFGVGQALPAGYDAYNVPQQYRDTWYDTDEDHYRYGDDAIYRVDAKSGIIESIVALLGGGLNVGQALPSGYDAYNLPMDYRDQYQDGDESMYRYADGNIYEVDAKTQIIQAIIETLV
jgi:hypothetical protein